VARGLQQQKRSYQFEAARLPNFCLDKLRRPDRAGGFFHVAPMAVTLAVFRVEHVANVTSLGPTQRYATETA
jgi:hypothetical protein